ncbi:MAG: 2-hydroxychromene-2-carboxylate isomerase [Candidatus Competibacteraceae bacterium]
MIPIEFWFDFASTYSYPAAARIEALARGEGISVIWKPFLLGPIFEQQGWNDSPFNIYPAQGRYMWRDLERICTDLNLPLRRPSVFPRNSVLAARVACCFASEPWLPEFVRQVFHANFADDLDIADRKVIEACLDRIGMPAADKIEFALAPANKKALRLRDFGIEPQPDVLLGRMVILQRQDVIRTGIDDRCTNGFWQPRINGRHAPWRSSNPSRSGNRRDLVGSWPACCASTHRAASANALIRCTAGFAPSRLPETACRRRTPARRLLGRRNAAVVHAVNAARNATGSIRPGVAQGIMRGNPIGQRQPQTALQPSCFLFGKRFHANQSSTPAEHRTTTRSSKYHAVNAVCSSLATGIGQISKIGAWVRK